MLQALQFGGSSSEGRLNCQPWSKIRRDSVPKPGHPRARQCLHSARGLHVTEGNCFQPYGRPRWTGTGTPLLIWEEFVPSPHASGCHPGLLLHLGCTFGSKCLWTCQTTFLHSREWTNKGKTFYPNELEFVYTKWSNLGRRLRDWSKKLDFL